MFDDRLPPIHPGEILDEEFLQPLKMSAGKLAKHLGVPRTRIERLVDQTTSVTPDTALRLGRFFGTSPEFWLNMQSSYDLKIAAAGNAEIIAGIEPLSEEARAAAAA